MNNDLKRVDKSIFAVVTAAGSGQRLGADLPKGLVPVGGEPLFLLSVKQVDQLESLTAGVITVPEAHYQKFAKVLAAAMDRQELSHPWYLVIGGGNRQTSIHNGLKFLAEHQDIALLDSAFALIHDAARALTPIAVFKRVISALECGYEVVVPAIPVVDTIRTVEKVSVDYRPGDNDVRIEVAGATVDRSQLRIVQTPQGFPFSLIYEVHNRWVAEKPGVEATDDATMSSDFGYTQVFVPGSEEAFKITVANDLDIAEFMLEKKSNYDDEV